MWLRWSGLNGSQMHAMCWCWAGIQGWLHPLSLLRAAAIHCDKSKTHAGAAPSPHPWTPLQDARLGERRRAERLSAVSFHFKGQTVDSVINDKHVRLKLKGTKKGHCVYAALLSFHFLSFLQAEFQKVWKGNLEEPLLSVCARRSY